MFFVRPLGFIVPTAARRICYGDSLKFETIHEAVYRDHDFKIVNVAAGVVEQRVTAIEARHGRKVNRPLAMQGESSGATY